MGLESSSEVEYSEDRELDVAVRAVQMACSLCQKVQDSLISKTGDEIQSKDDNSPVTVAGQSVTLSFLHFESGLCSFSIILLIL